MFFQLTPTRIFIVYFVQSLVLAFYVFIIHRLLKDKNKITKKKIIFSFYYLFCSIGIIINYIYAPLQIPSISNILYLITIYFIYNGTIFISIFTLEVYFEIKSNKEITKVQVFMVLTCIILSSAIFFIPEGIKISIDTNWMPVVSFTFFIYCTIMLSANFSIFIIYSHKTLKIFKERSESQVIIFRWKTFMIGIVETYIFALFTMMINMLDRIDLRFLWSVVGGLIMISGVYLTWYGIGKKFL